MMLRLSSRFASLAFVILIVILFSAASTSPGAALGQQYSLPPTGQLYSLGSHAPDLLGQSAAGGEVVPLPPLEAKPDISVPYFELWPEAAGVGEAVAVRGLNFCPTSSCAAVTISVNDTPVLEDVVVNDDGSFVAYITAFDPQGLQRVSAMQADRNGLTLSDSKLLIVTSPGQAEAQQQDQSQVVITPTISVMDPRYDYQPTGSEVIPTPAENSSINVLAFQPNIKWGGRSVAVDVVPGNRDEAVAASESGGLFRTTNQGANWSHLDNLPAFRMFDVKYASTDGSIVIATSAYNSRTANDGGIWRSTNHGVNWSKPATATPPCSGGRVNAYGITVVFSRNEVFVGTDCGLAVSHDQGATWTHISNWNTISPRVLSVSARDYGGAGSVVDLCGDFGHRRSTDSGASWTQANDLPAPYAYCPNLAVHAIAQSPIDQNVLFVAKWDSPITCGIGTVSRYALYESDNGGASWVRRQFECGIDRPPSVLTDSTASAGQISVHYSDGLNLFQQFCSGVAPNPRCTTTWTSVPVDHTSVNGMAIDPAFYCPMYAVSDGGVHQTTDCGASFHMVGAGNAGYQALQVYEVQDQVHPALPTDLYFGTQDNDVWSSVDSGVTWPGEFCCEGFFISLLHQTPNNIGQKINFTACPSCVNFQSDPSLSGWTYWNNPPNSGSSPLIVAANVYLQFSQVSPPSNTTNILYITTNNGGIWTQVPGVSISEPLVGRPMLSGPAANPTLYVGVQKAGGVIGLRKITNIRGPGNGVVSAADTGLGNIGIYCMGQGTYVCPIVVGANPSNTGHLIAADVTASQMKVTTNGGASWSNIPRLTNLVLGNGLFNFVQGTIVQPHFIQWDVANTNRIFVSTDEAGVLYSQDGGATWGRLVDSEKVVNGTSFATDEVLGRTLVASYGRGLWQLEFTQANLTVAKSSPASIGSQVHFTITVTNNGPAIAENTIMTDTLPANTTFASLSAASGGWTCTTPTVGSTGTVSCNGGDRANADISTFTLVLNVNAGVPGGAPICNTATARSDILDLTPANSATSCSTELGELVVDRGDDTNVTTCSALPNDCTLRGAINKVNGLNTEHAVIRFSPSVTIIGLVNSLPAITAHGTAIIGAGGAPVISGSAMPGGDALQINTDEVTIQGLSIVNVPSGGSDVHVLNGLGTQIADNYLGTFPEGVGVTDCSAGGVTRNASYGVLMDGTVNGTSLNPALWAYGNRVGCHAVYGIVIFGADGAIIGRTPGGEASANFIGTNATNAILPNGVGVGVLANGVNGARSNTVVNNNIQHNNQAGIWLLGTGTNNLNSTSSNVIAGNLITDNGRNNGAGGVYLSGGAYFNVIGGENDEETNIIEANLGNGISIYNSNSNGILGNHIGNLHANGSNTGSGIYINQGASNWVGGFFFLVGSLQRGNVIGGNDKNGIDIVNQATDTLITRNKIGTNLDATAPLANTLSGVSISDNANNNRIGNGTSLGNNTIAFNANGVKMTSGAHDNRIEVTDIYSNQFYGVLFDTAVNNMVNDATIHQNGYAGIGEYSGTSDNRWSRISTYANGGLGIDWSIIGDVQNEPTPPWPLITEVIVSGGSTTVRGVADSTNVFRTVQVELYLVAQDPTGYGEGRTYLGTTATDVNGNWQIVVASTAPMCLTAFETEHDILNNIYWFSTEFGPGTCRGFMPSLSK